MNSSNSPQTNPTPTGESAPSAAGGIASVKERIKVAARETVDQVKSTASSTVSRAKEETGKIVSDKQHVAAEEIGGYSSAIHDAAKSLEEKDPNIAWFTHRAADRLQGVAEYLRHRDLGGLRRDAEDLARRHPAIFFGGLFVVGLGLGNMFKASNGPAANPAGAERARRDEEDREVPGNAAAQAQNDNDAVSRTETGDLGTSGIAIK